MGHPKRKRSYSNHSFFRGYVSFREGNITTGNHFQPRNRWHPLDWHWDDFLATNDPSKRHKFQTSWLAMIIWMGFFVAYLLSIFKKKSLQQLPKQHPPLIIPRLFFPHLFRNGSRWSFCRRLLQAQTSNSCGRRSVGTSENSGHMLNTASLQARCAVLLNLGGFNGPPGFPAEGLHLTAKWLPSRELTYPL